MMGAALLTPDEHRAQSEAISRRKEKVAASLGKTVEELDSARRRLCFGCTSDTAASSVEGEEGSQGPADGAVPDEEAPNEETVDEEAVLAFIRSRQGVIERQRSRIRSLESQLAHLENQLALSNRKNEALRSALAQARAKRDEAARPEG